LSLPSEVANTYPDLLKAERCLWIVAGEAISLKESISLTA